MHEEENHALGPGLLRGGPTGGSSLFSQQSVQSERSKPGPGALEHGAACQRVGSSGGAEFHGNGYSM